MAFKWTKKAHLQRLEGHVHDMLRTIDLAYEDPENFSDQVDVLEQQAEKLLKDLKDKLHWTIEE